MLTFELRRRVFWGLVWSFLVFAVVGCQSTKPAPRTRSSAETVAPASSMQSKRSRLPVERPQRIDAGVTENADGGDTRESVIEPRRISPPRPPRLSKPREKKRNIDEDERHPSKWRQKLKAKYA